MNINKNAEKARSTKRLVLILVTIGVVVSAAVLAYYFMNTTRRSDPNDPDYVNPEFCNSIPRYSDDRCFWDP